MVFEQDSKGHMHRRIVKEEHITVTKEPQGEYLAHFTPESPEKKEKPAYKEAQGLHELLVDQKSEESCIVIGLPRPPPPTSPYARRPPPSPAPR